MNDPSKQVHVVAHLTGQPAQIEALAAELLTFFAAEGDAGGPFRGWHPPLIQKLLPAEVFPGVGVLEVQTIEDAPNGTRAPLTMALMRALEQRLAAGDQPPRSGEPDAGRTHRVFPVVTSFVAWQQAFPIAKHHTIFFKFERPALMNQGVGLLPLQGQIG